MDLPPLTEKNQFLFLLLLSLVSTKWEENIFFHFLCGANIWLQKFAALLILSPPINKPPDTTDYKLVAIFKLLAKKFRQQFRIKYLWWLDWIILELFADLNNSMTLNLPPFCWQWNSYKSCIYCFFNNP